MAKVTIRWLGHSGFSIQDPSGKTVLVDPWLEGNPKAPGAAPPAADFLLVTHDHSDHSGDVARIASLTGATVVGIYEVINDLKARGLPEARLINGGLGMNVGGTVELGGFSFTMTQALHSSTLGSPAGYVIRTPSGAAVYHAGDTGLFAGMALIGELYPLDVALLPIGSYFTMDYRQAARAAALLRPKAVVPMHYGTFPVLEPSADRFVAEAKRVAPGVRVVVLEPGEEAAF